MENNNNMSFSIGSAPETYAETNQPKTPNPNPQKRKKKTKQTLAKKIGTYLLRAGAFIGTFLLAALLVIVIALKMICSDRFPSAQQMFVTTVLETGNFKFLASVFLP